MVSRSIYNLKIDTIYMYDIPFDRSFLQLSDSIRHVMPSTDTKPELTAKASVAQPVSQPAVYANGLICHVNKDTYLNPEDPEPTVENLSAFAQTNTGMLEYFLVLIC
jgi:hypothetical protein